MLNIEELHLHYRHYKSGKMYRRKLYPASSDPATLKLTIGRQLLAIQEKAQYYYVVGVVRLPDGEKGYRTIIGKHAFRDVDGQWLYPR